MNPYRIYRDEWARALAVQTTATKYRTFVAMPFQERFSYRSREILSGVIGAAVDEANRRGQTPRQFDIPERIDVPMGAAVITEEIILRILESHIFMADVTFENAGVLLETGIALGTKPNRQIMVLDVLKRAVAEALERKRKLGQYAVIWREGRVVCTGPDAPVVLGVPSAGKKS